MEEILHHLGCIKPCKWWDKLSINWLAGFQPSTVWMIWMNCYLPWDNTLYTDNSQVFFVTGQVMFHFLPWDKSTPNRRSCWIFVCQSPSAKIHNNTPLKKIAWNPKMGGLQMRFLFLSGAFIRFHVDFWWTPYMFRPWDFGRYDWKGIWMEVRRWIMREPCSWYIWNNSWL